MDRFILNFVMDFRTLLKYIDLKLEKMEQRLKKKLGDDIYEKQD